MDEKEFLDNLLKNGYVYVALVAYVLGRFKAFHLELSSYFAFVKGSLGRIEKLLGGGKDVNSSS